MLSSRRLSRRHSLLSDETGTAIYEVNNANTFDYFVASTSTTTMGDNLVFEDDFDNFDFFDGFDFDNEAAAAGAPTMAQEGSLEPELKRSNTPATSLDLGDVERFEQVFADMEQEEAEEAGVKQQLLLGIYTQEERERMLEAYREKRKRRVYGKVRYVLRQKVSENRPRVKGRFVPKPMETPTRQATDEERPRKRPSMISALKTWTISSHRTTTSSVPPGSPASNSTAPNSPNSPPSANKKRSSLPLSALRLSTSSSKSAGEQLWSEKLMELRNKKRNNSTTAASTESHKAKKEIPFVSSPAKQAAAQPMVTDADFDIL